MKTVKRLKYKNVSPSRHYIRLPSAGFGQRAAQVALDEHLTGAVQGLTASAPEERSARALDKNQQVIEYFFRVPVGGPRNTPGWKELDFLIHAKSGLWYLVEVDSVFSHRQKTNADVLHDAILLDALSYLGPYPKVFHVGSGANTVENAGVDTQDQAIETFRRLIV